MYAIRSYYELVFERNKLPARIASYSYLGADDALAGNRETARNNFV